MIVVDPVDPADSVALAVLSCPAVAALAGGGYGEVATYLPGRRIPGVRLRPTEVTISVVARFGFTMADVAAQVRAAVAPLVPGVAVHVSIDDIQLTPTLSP